LAMIACAIFLASGFDPSRNSVFDMSMAPVW
jgi:hypothetical protein